MQKYFRLRRSKIRVILGDHDQFSTTETKAIMRAVSAIIRHRNFDSNTYNHDIALLKLRKSVPFSKTIKPVCLPADHDDPAGDKHNSILIEMSRIYILLIEQVKQE